VRTRTTIAVSAAAAALAVAGCGSSSSSSSGPYAGAPAPSPASAATAPAQVATMKTSLGTVLVDKSGRTLYLWDGDHGSSSSCNGGCAGEWPPVTTKGKPTATGSTKASLIGTTKRSDGSVEVTYAGHPLYTFAGDSGSGQTNGEGNNGFGATWWTVAPGGAAITR
jgi:predicted lipoprotein with Yx(FWY)xxD motif